MTGKEVYFTVTCQKVIGLFTAIPGTNNNYARIIQAAAKD